MTGKKHPVSKGSEGDAETSEVKMNLVINPYQPLVYIDGAVLNPTNGMVEMMLTKVNLSSPSIEGGSNDNTVQGRYIMHMETFSRIAKLFEDQFEKLSNAPKLPNTENDKH